MCVTRALVHCFMGRSRSVSVAAAYAMHAMDRMDPAEALAAIKARRPEAGPNYGFLRQLDEWAAGRAGRRRDVPVVPPAPALGRWRCEASLVVRRGGTSPRLALTLALHAVA